jgi:hypothetical protein
MGTGNFSNASLGAAGTQWAYEMSGWLKKSDGTYTPYSEVGSMTIDGNGNITAGTDDYWGQITSGTYSITNNGTGTLKLSATGKAGVQALVWNISLANESATNSAGSFVVSEADSFASAAGAAFQQDSTAVGTTPTGSFVFRTHATSPGTSIAGSQDSVGLLTLSTHTVSGNEDWVNGGVASGQFSNFSGTLTDPASGIGTISFEDGLGSRTFDYFIVDANTLLLYETDDANEGRGLGRAELQQAPSGGFVNGSFTGSFAFGGQGDTSASAAGGVNSVGQLAADGAGNITAGAIDFTRDGAAQLGLSVAATTYALAANGRVTATLSPSAGSAVSIVLYLVSPTRGFFLVSGDLTTVEDGTLDQQSSTSFSVADFNGQYAFTMGGALSGVPLDRVGTIQTDGKGDLGLNEQADSGGTENSACQVGTYSVTSNGRVTSSISSVSTNLIFYLVSPNSAYVLQGDTGAQVRGGLANQDHQATPVVPGVF